MQLRSWSIRPKAIRDAEAVVALLAEVAREGEWIATEWPFDIDARARSIRDAIASRTIVGWVAVEDGAVVGDLTVFGLQADAPVLGMAVTATHRGRGIGRALIEGVVAWARQNRKPALELRVFPHNEAARALYASTGFVEVRLEKASIPRRDGRAQDAILMRKELVRT